MGDGEMETCLSIPFSTDDAQLHPTFALVSY